MEVSVVRLAWGHSIYDSVARIHVFSEKSVGNRRGYLDTVYVDAIIRGSAAVASQKDEGDYLPARYM